MYSFQWLADSAGDFHHKWISHCSAYFPYFSRASSEWFSCVVEILSPQHRNNIIIQIRPNSYLHHLLAAYSLSWRKTVRNNNVTGYAAWFISILLSCILFEPVQSLFAWYENPVRVRVISMHVCSPKTIGQMFLSPLERDLPVQEFNKTASSLPAAIQDGNSAVI